MTALFLSVLAGYGLLVGALFLGQRTMIYVPDPTVPNPHAFGVPEMIPVRLAVEDGRIDLLSWWGAPQAQGMPVVVYFHGNAGHIGERAYKARILLDQGFGVFLAGYRYNAGSKGKPSEAALLADGQRIIEHVVSAGFGMERIVLYGESLGSGVAVAMAADYPVAGLILETPYTSIADVAQARFWFAPAKWLVRDRFDSLARIGRVRAPVLVFHGNADTTVPIRFAKRLFAATPDPKEAHFLPGGRHTDLYDLGAGDIVVSFLRRLTGKMGAV